jgi:hypothetical protein
MGITTLARNPANGVLFGLMKEFLHTQLRRRNIMKRLAITIALTCALCGPALAGEMDTGGFAPPPPPANVQATLSGEVPSCGSVQPTIADQVIVNVLEILSAGYLSIY